MKFSFKRSDYGFLEAGIIIAAIAIITLAIVAYLASRGSNPLPESENGNSMAPDIEEPVTAQNSPANVSTIQ